MNYLEKINDYPFSSKTVAITSTLLTGAAYLESRNELDSVPLTLRIGTYAMTLALNATAVLQIRSGE